MPYTYTTTSCTYGDAFTIYSQCLLLKASQIRRTHTHTHWTLIHRVTHFTFIHNAALYPHNIDALYTLWHRLHLQITVPYSHTQRRLMHTLRRRLHTMTLLHLHTTPHYTHEIMTPYTHKDVFIHTATPLTFTPKCRLIHAPQKRRIHTQRRFIHILTSFTFIDASALSTKKIPYKKTNYTYTNAFYPYTQRRLIHASHRRLIHTTNDALYLQRRLSRFAPNATL